MSYNFQFLLDNNIMRPHNKIIGSEFKAKLKQLALSYPSQSIKLNQFLTLLLANNIRLYSRADLAKISKFFDNPLKIAKITIPLSYFHLECVQQTNKRKSFIIKISSRIQHSLANQQAQEEHSTQRCLSTLTKILNNHYGSEKNWFKVLGGLTISVTIEKRIFKAQIEKLLQNTVHMGCANKLVKLFTDNFKSNQIQWLNFMKIIQKANNSPKKIQSHARCKTADFQGDQNRRHILPFRKTEGFNLDNGIVVEKIRKPFHTGQFWSQIDRESTFELRPSMTLQSKQCCMHQREKSLRKTERIRITTRNRTEPTIIIQNN